MLLIYFLKSMHIWHMLIVGHFSPMFHFYTPENVKKPLAFWRLINAFIAQYLWLEKRVPLDLTNLVNIIPISGALLTQSHVFFAFALEHSKNLPVFLSNLLNLLFGLKASFFAWQYFPSSLATVPWRHNCL